MLAQHFQSVHKDDINSYTEQQKQIKGQVSEFINTTGNADQKYLKQTKADKFEINRLIRNLPNNKASGIDKISNKIIKKLSQKTITQLKNIINAIFKLGHFPNTYKTAVIVPIPKPNKDSNNPENYRPISLLSTTSKFIEKIINNRILKAQKQLKINSEIQFGFKRKHNTTQQLARIVNDIIINFNKDKVTTLTSLDLEKAFDKVWIDGLIYKMMNFKFNKYLIKLIYSYLTNRKFKVAVNNEFSDTKKTQRGVPQGSVLGPTLFAIYLYDIPQFLKTNTALYADDTAIYSHSFNAQVSTTQNQLHIYKLEKYSEDWKLKLNANKTEHILFTRKFTKYSQK
ncbi:RVT 1 domain containing protein [Asbolus verrucosus]|uniref:RVT 1 domain containing protein n=1 Tax=Asbolus verrucosus TaxID=1661398 RepID=A0A482VBV2_ASBVE|nr:RVT 1 domain containing protein [Asbolus verrucosus]